MNEHSPKPVAGNVAIVIYPYRNPQESAPQTRPLRLVTVLAPLVKKVFIVTGNFSAMISHKNVTVINVNAPDVKIVGEPLVSKIFRLFLAQFTLSIAIVRLQLNKATRVETFFFFGGETLLLPAITCRLLHRRVVLILRASLEKAMELEKSPFSRVLAFFKRVNMELSDNILIFSETLIEHWNLERYQKKVLLAPYNFIDTDTFKPNEALTSKRNMIGYVGRVDIGKGVMNFVHAIPIILKKMDDIGVLIVGDVQTQEKIEQYIKRERLNDFVKITGWVSHDEIPYYLNQLQLLVLPSYSEGLPNIVLEAMACGTPVLSTPVGSITDIIKDGETGFIMEDNSPECIAKNIIRALNCTTLGRISQAARTLIENEHTYRAAVEKYRIILSNSE